ncbi:hypothetical protein ACI7BZ_05790 [Xanthobacter sp. AM11]|uniref:hypothetical protein n=1 Tax=Xanthobacter sp. AM11 TaxID=3380643 RepID=UPI0039BF2BE5
MALALALAGCGAGEGLDGSFGAQDVGVAAGGTSAGVVNSVTTGALTVGTGNSAQTYDCPVVTVRTGAATWQVTDKSTGALRLQGSIGRLARECMIVGGNMQVKVGIEGRILLGEKGAPGQVKVPIRIAVVQEGPTPKTITTKFFLVPVDVPTDLGQAAFTVVEDQVMFPLLKPGEMERYVVYVGFDPQGSEAKEKPKASAAAKPRKPPASSGGSDSEVFGPKPQ